MKQKTLFTTIGVMLAVMVAAVTLVFTVGPMVSADSVGIVEGCEMFDIDENNVLNGLSDVGIDYVNQFNKIYIIIPDKVTEIYAGTFCDFANLVGVTIPEGVTRIGNAAFGGSGLMSIRIPSTVEDIGEYAFSECINLSNITFAENSQLNYIEWAAFYDCTSITSIIIPKGVRMIEEDAFRGCTGLSKVYCEVSEEVSSNWSVDWIYGVDNAEIMWNCKHVKFDTGSDMLIDEQIVESGYQIVPPVKPIRNGYTFKGWYLGSEAYDFNTPVTGNITLTAQWEADENQQNTQNENEQNENQEPETPTETSLVNETNKNGVIAAVAGTTGGAAGLGTIGTILGVAISKKRKK